MRGPRTGPRRATPSLTVSLLRTSATEGSSPCCLAGRTRHLGDRKVPPRLSAAALDERRSVLQRRGATKHTGQTVPGPRSRPADALPETDQAAPLTGVPREARERLGRVDVGTRPGPRDAANWRPHQSVSAGSWAAACPEHLHPTRKGTLATRCGERYVLPMKTVDQLLQEVLALPAPVRARFAQEIEQSLEPRASTSHPRSGPKPGGRSSTGESPSSGLGLCRLYRGTRLSKGSGPNSLRSDLRGPS